jgi:hypothetical protein
MRVLLDESIPRKLKFCIARPLCAHGAADGLERLGQRQTAGCCGGCFAERIGCAIVMLSIWLILPKIVFLIVVKKQLMHALVAPNHWLALMLAMVLY